MEIQIFFVFLQKISISLSIIIPHMTMHTSFSSNTDSQNKNVIKTL